jgi:hypothetical protein
MHLSLRNPIIFAPTTCVKVVYLYELGPYYICPPPRAELRYCVLKAYTPLRSAISYPSSPTTRSFNFVVIHRFSVRSYGGTLRHGTLVVHYATVLWWSSTPRSSDSLLLLCRWTTTCPRGPSTTTVAAVSATGGGAARGGGGPGTLEYDEAVLIRGEDFMKMTMWTWFGDDHDAYKSKYDYVSRVVWETSACTPQTQAVTPM